MKLLIVHTMEEHDRYDKLIEFLKATTYNGYYIGTQYLLFNMMMEDDDMDGEDTVEFAIREYGVNNGYFGTYYFGVYSEEDAIRTEKFFVQCMSEFDISDRSEYILQVIDSGLLLTNELKLFLLKNVDYKESRFELL